MGRYILLKFILMISVIPAFAQSPRTDGQSPPPPPPASMAENVCSVTIFNSTGAAITFQASTYDADPWVAKTITSGTNSNLCLGTGPNDVFIKFSTKTKDGKVVPRHYRLVVGSRYRFEANRTCECWDLMLLKPPK